MSHSALPPKQGLYDPCYERDACGVGFIAHIKGHKNHILGKSFYLKNICLKYCYSGFGNP